MEYLVNWGTDLIVAVQRWPALEPIMEAVTFLGKEEFFLLLMPALFWCWDSALGARLAVVIVGSNALNSLLKLLFHLPRPYWVDPRVQALSTETSYGLPSAHGQNAMAVWGFVARQARQARRTLAWVLALALTVLIAFSRLYLGVHFLGDLLAGLVIGALLLAAYLAWEAPAAAWLGRLGLWAQIGVSALISLGFLAVALGVVAPGAGRTDPAAWEAAAAAAAPPEAGTAAIDPRNPASPVAAAGMILGLGAALACQTRWARFDARGPWRKRVARYLLGLAGVLLFWRGLALVLPEEPLALGLAFRYLRYALVVFWALYLAPALFLRLGLAEPQGRD